MSTYTPTSTDLLQRGQFDALTVGSRHTVYEPSRIGSGLKAMATALMTWLSTGTEPHISKFMQGNTEVWKAYDPVGDRTLYFYEEDELRAWLDHRFYQ
jgi:hypothetical protein